ncbi:hypothetical protein ACV1C4_05520 [Aeromonas hydrophila]
MKFEDITNELVQKLVEAFYVYQSALITTPLGSVGVNNEPKYPTYFYKYNAEMDRLAKELFEFGIQVKEAKLPENSNSFSETSFLHDFERQQALRFVLVQDTAVIQPPMELYSMVRYFIETLRTPWH